MPKRHKADVWNCGHPRTPENTREQKGLPEGRCRECSVVRVARWRNTNRERSRASSRAYRSRNLAKVNASNVAYRRLRATGWSAAEYNDAFAVQEGCCALCGRHVSESPMALHADHCHSTGVRRQLLCSLCNTGIGSLQDDPTLLRAAADYIERFRQAA